MKEIEVGEYVRTKKGSILENTLEGHKSIIENIEKDEDYIREFGEIVKHSKNIKEVIEDGDYINGYLVRKIDGELCNFDLNEMKWIPLKNIDIFEGIVTKEKFENIKYELV